LRIIIVTKQTKRGLKYYAYHRGVFSFFHVFCFINQILFTGYESFEDCISAAEGRLAPDPPRNTKIVDVIDYKFDGAEYGIIDDQIYLPPTKEEP